MLNFYRNIGLLCILVLTVKLLTSCEDKCKQTRTYRTTKPIVFTLKELRTAIKSGPKEILQKPGKIYIKDNYLFINEIKKGIHIIDNTNPSNPSFVSFIKIPGNIDMAVVDNVLYADSYSDFVALDITNPTQIKELNRVEKVYPYGAVDGLSWYYNEQNGTITDYEWIIKTDTIDVSCNGYAYPIYYGGYGNAYDLSSKSYSSSSGGQTTAPGTSGTAGSMARFGITNGYLYAVSNNELIPFNIANPPNPILGKKINLNWGIETIFPYKDMIFIGSNTGMDIYNVKNPAEPIKLSTFSHFKACDPVVVYDNYAYVTLRSTNESGARCGVVNENILKVVDIADPTNPKEVISYKMDTPAGLGIDYPNLFICNGTKGITRFSMVDPFKIDKNQLAKFTDLDAFDLIPRNKNLMVIGKEGLYQYDYSDPKNLKLLSTIKAIKPLF